MIVGLCTLENIYYTKTIEIAGNTRAFGRSKINNLAPN